MRSRQHARAAARTGPSTPWIKAWSDACTGVRCDGMQPFFLNSVKMVIPAVLISTILGALNGYVLTQVALPRRRPDLRADAVRLLHSVPDGAAADGASSNRHARAVATRIDRVWCSSTSSTASASPRCSSATTTQHSRPNWSRRRRSTAPASSRSSAASCCRTRCRSSWSRVIWQFTKIWNDFLFGVVSLPAAIRCR